MPTLEIEVTPHTMKSLAQNWVVWNLGLDFNIVGGENETSYPIYFGFRGHGINMEIEVGKLVIKKGKVRGPTMKMAQKAVKDQIKTLYEVFIASSSTSNDAKSESVKGDE
jgi:hypothetical protein